MDPSDPHAGSLPDGGVRAATPRRAGPPVLRCALCRRATPPTPVSDARSSVGCSHGRQRPSLLFRQVGAHDFTFEACSGFTHVAARRLADPPTVGLCPEGFDQSVTLLAASVATGVSPTTPQAGLAPARTQRLSRRTE